jgi:hypothetical protein
MALVPQHNIGAGLYPILSGGGFAYTHLPIKTVASSHQISEAEYPEYPGKTPRYYSRVCQIARPDIPNIIFHFRPLG